MKSRPLRPLPALAALALATALLGGCDTDAGQAAASSATRHYGDIAFEPCTLASGWTARNVQAQCATFEVPEDRGNAELPLAIAECCQSSDCCSAEPAG